MNRDDVSSATPVARSLSFGESADAYHAVRPDYPDEVIDLVLAGAPRSVLDVGCGTGKASLAIMARGVEVTGVEPDPRMAEVARSHGVSVVVGTFEEWEPTPHDAIVSAQAWHWVDPIAGAAKAAAVLSPGGRWNALWYRDDEPELAAVLQHAYERWAPHLVDERARAAVTEQRRVETALDALRATGHFDEAGLHEMSWVESMSVGRLIERLSTLSAHQTLPARDAGRVHDAVADAFGGRDETCAIRYRMILVSAVERGASGPVSRSSDGLRRG